MAKHGMPEVKESCPNVTPLIDVVMCLIVFFMLVAKIGVNTGAEAMDNLPETLLGKKIDAMGNTLTLNIYDRGAGLDPRITALVPDLATGQAEQKEIQLVNTETKRRDLEDVLRRLAKPAPEGIGESFNVILRAGGNVPYRDTERILITCAQAGVKTVSFNTKKMVETETAE